MTDAHNIEADSREENGNGLYVSDRKIIRRWGYGEKLGYRILRRLDRGLPNFRAYPQPDPIFGRRFWPEVLQWHLDYHRVRASADPRLAPTDQPRWTENFDEPAPRKTRRAQHAGTELATA